MTSVRTSFDGACATITLDRPEGNRINFAMRRELRDAVAMVAASDARVVVVSGAGPDFCRGGDVREWIGVPSAELRPKIEVYADALRDLAALPIPTLAMVQGGCMGGGFELALACDLIVAASDAVFRFPEAKSGILTLQGGALTLAGRIGYAKALEIVLLAEPLSSSRLAEWNVVNLVVERHGLEDGVAGILDRLAHAPPNVCAATKALFRKAREQGPDVAMRDWYDISMPLFDLPETDRLLRATAESLSGASAS